MIIADINDAARYYALHPLFKTFFEYINTHDLLAAPCGRITLQGDDLFINVNDTQMQSREAQKLEVHQCYIDIHVPLSGDEEIGWRHLEKDMVSNNPFDRDNDFALFTAASDKWFTLHPGQFCIVFPEDAHAPAVGKGTIRKLVAKIKI